MSFLTRTALRSRIPLRLVSPTIRPFHVSTTRAALSESDHDQDEGSRKETIDHHKNDQLKKQKEGRAIWKKELSTNSESAIKADREETTNAEGEIEILQKETSEFMQENHEQGRKK